MHYRPYYGHKVSTPSYRHVHEWRIRLQYCGLCTPNYNVCGPWAMSPAYHPPLHTTIPAKIQIRLRRPARAHGTGTSTATRPCRTCHRIRRARQLRRGPDAAELVSDVVSARTIRSLRVSKICYGSDGPMTVAILGVPSIGIVRSPVRIS